ncbi:Ataxin-3, partial [Phenoliferia sp. Uapishka_3]
MADLIPDIYHEKVSLRLHTLGKRISQARTPKLTFPSVRFPTFSARPMLCAQHALNNLLQSSLFTPQDLADIARQLDQLEADQLDGSGDGESHNYDDSGFFSIMVMEEALKVLGLRLVRWKSEEMKGFHENPETPVVRKMQGFVLNHQLHWYTIRRFGPESRWYNLDSCTPTPVWISPMLLGLTLREAEIRGYSILAVIPTSDARIDGLPSCPAEDRAIKLPPPKAPSSSSSARGGSLASSNPFQGKGNVLGSSSSSKSTPTPSTSNGKSKLVLPLPIPQSSSPSSSSTAKASTSNQPRSKRRQISPSPSADTDAQSSGTGSGTSSVEEESEKRRRRPRLDEDENMGGDVEGDVWGGMSGAEGAVGGAGMSEEDMMAFAISESLKASSLEDTTASSSTPKSSKSKSKSKAKAAKAKSKDKEKEQEEEELSGDEFTKREGGKEDWQREGDEDEDLKAALKASLEESGNGENGAVANTKEEENGEEDDSPSVEELRRRRLARFG